AAGRAAVVAPAPDPALARVALGTMSRRDDGTAYLSGWTARDLRVLAASLELRGVAGLRKADLVDRIVDRTIGFRLASAAIRRR
ncbi:Rho termination factor N-terminal domain-containing protein, partial [Micromonospora sp. NPDC023633]|uniref:Rho termination factor N-terminal domain-containing protein n=1 Tax=Micromonospora sp. NPDC023633 TaxID=3154320 RepID=UPI0033F969FC